MLHILKGWPLIFLLFFTLEGNAMWAPMTEAQLIEKSNLIIVGELLGESEIQGLSSDQNVNLGVIRVDKLLKGTVVSTLVFLALPSNAQAISSSDIHYRTGAKGLWYLRARQEGETIYLADHPHRFVDEKTASARIKKLQQQFSAQR